jgi:hypothetical protein
MVGVALVVILGNSGVATAARPATEAERIDLTEAAEGWLNAAPPQPPHSLTPRVIYRVTLSDARISTVDERWAAAILDSEPPGWSGAPAVFVNEAGFFRLYALGVPPTCGEGSPNFPTESVAADLEISCRPLMGTVKQSPTMTAASARCKAAVRASHHWHRRASVAKRHLREARGLRGKKRWQRAGSRRLHAYHRSRQHALWVCS